MEQPTSTQPFNITIKHNNRTLHLSIPSTEKQISIDIQDQKIDINVGTATEPASAPPPPPTEDLQPKEEQTIIEEEEEEQTAIEKEDEEEAPPQPETIFRIRPLNPELLERKRKEKAEREQATKNTFDSLFYIQM